MSEATALAAAAIDSRMVPVNDLHVHPRNLRAELGDLTGLVSSIKNGGIRQPLRVAPREEGGFWIVAGHRRHAAALSVGLDGCPAPSG